MRMQLIACVGVGFLLGMLYMDTWPSWRHRDELAYWKGSAHEWQGQMTRCLSELEKVTVVLKKKVEQQP